MKHRTTAAVAALAAGVMSAGVAHAVGGSGKQPSGTTVQHGHGNTHTQTVTHPNNGTHGHNGQKHSHGTSQHGCKFRWVGYVAKGVLESQPTFDSSPGGGKFNIDG